jgi:sec-independent protein translocase protein TatC
MAVAWFFVDRISSFILGPTLSVLPAGERLVLVRPGEGFAFDLDIALIGGCVLATPLVMYQVWRFIAPGLYAREKRFAIPFVILMTAGSLGGALFNHYMLFPGMMAFFGSFDSPLMKFMPGVAATFQLYTRMLIGMVLAFQMPTLIFSLARMQLVSAGSLWRHVKYAILAIFIVAAALTPSPDPWTQAVFAAPMIALYLISIGIAWIARSKNDKPRDHQPGKTALGLLIAAAVVEGRRRFRRAADETRRQWRWSV